MADPIFCKEDYGNGVIGYSIDAGATMLAEAQEAWERMPPEERAKLPKGHSAVITTVHEGTPDDALHRLREFTAELSTSGRKRPDGLAVGDGIFAARNPTRGSNAVPYAFSY